MDERWQLFQMLDAAEENDFEVIIEVFRKGTDFVMKVEDWNDHIFWENFSKVQKLVVVQNFKAVIAILAEVLGASAGQLGLMWLWYDRSNNTN